MRTDERTLTPRDVSLRTVWYRQVGDDLRYALRLAGRNRWFTVVTVLTLALGLSTNVTLLSMINLLLFKPLPVKDADRLVVLLEQGGGSEALRGVSWADYRDYRARVDAFTDVLAVSFRPAYVSVTGRSSDRLWIEGVSGNYFAMLGVLPSTGRLFLPGEGETPGADPIVVLSHQYWQTRLGSDPTIVGRTIRVNGRPLTVIGIAPPTFTSAQWAMAPSAYVPATMLPQLFAEDEELLEARGGGAFRVMAHLRPGVGAERATAAVQVVTRQLIAAYRPEQTNARVLVWPEPRTRPVPGLNRFVPFAAAIFMSMAVLVLFTACANVANLMFSRALVRQREMGLRTALGASRARLVQQLLTESVFLALIAGAVGLLLSYGVGQLLARFVPAGEIPVRPDDRFDWQVALVTVLVSGIAGILTALVPALRSTTSDVVSTLQREGSGTVSARQGFRSQLVMSQVAVCVVVLICGGLFLRSLQGLSGHDLGFRAEGVVMASLDLGLPGFDEARGRRLIEQLPARMQATSGVEAAAIGTSVPFDNSHEIRAVQPADDLDTDTDTDTGTDTGARADRGRGVRAGVNRIDAGYLRTMGVTLLQGRDFTHLDQQSTPRVAIVNQTFARRLWRDKDPLGQRFRWQGRSGPDALVEVVGIVRDGKYIAVGESPRAYVYLPIAQEYGTNITLHVRAAGGDPIALTTALRRLVQELEPDVPIFNVRTMPDHLRGSVFAFLPVRVGALLASVQGALALLLAMMSVYGVVAWSVSRQTRTIGVHIALGAQQRDVVRLVSRSALRPALMGLAVGVAASILFARILARLLYGLNPMNVPVFLGVGVLVLGVSLLACWLPARRAMHIDPVNALRTE